MDFLIVIHQYLAIKDLESIWSILNPNFLNIGNKPNRTVSSASLSH